MRKALVLVILALLTLTGISGCSAEKETQKNLTTPLNTIEITSMDETQIRTTAFQWLNNNYKGIISNWETAKVTEYKLEHEIETDKGAIEINGIDTYKVVFEVPKDSLLGAITVYVDKQSGNVLGTDLRE